MNYKTIYAKCPYCKSEFPWIFITGEYAARESKETCKNCGKQSLISVTNIMKFSAKKERQAKADV